MKLGFHVSIADKLDLSVDRAIELGCTTFQIFTSNPRSWLSKPLSPEIVKMFRKKINKSKIYPVYAHTPYLLNLSSPNYKIYIRSVESFQNEYRRAHLLGIPYLVTHLGSHIDSGKKIGEQRITEALKTVIDLPGPMVLLENNSNSGSHIGSQLEDISSIISQVSWKVGTCFDTCHAYASGYDFRSKNAYDITMRKIRNTIGIKGIKLVHLNDAVGTLGSGIDRHEHIGLGQIGEIGFHNILMGQLSRKPLVMETPIDSRRSNLDNFRTVYRLSGQG